MDSVHGVESTITTPMLFATYLAAISPDVSTAMVQWTFGCLSTSHLLVIPLMYMSHLYSEMKDNPNSKKTSSLGFSILFTLVPCAILQSVGLSVFAMYTQDASRTYGNPEGINEVAGGMMGVQILFVVVVVLLVLLEFMSMRVSQNYVSWIYTCIDVSMKLVLGCTLAMHAETKHFPVLSCKVWDGSYVD